MYLVTMKLADASIRAFNYRTIAGAERDAKKNGATIQAVQKGVRSDPVLRLRSA